jgi:uncharacterized protein (TIGR02231 family)
MKLEAPIVAATVYANQAHITRQGHVEVESGQFDFVLGGLPNSLSADSLRVRGRGSAQTRLLGVELRQAFYAQPQQVNVQELLHHVRELQRQDRVLAAQWEIEQKSKEFSTTLLQSIGEQLGRGITWGHAQVTDSTSILGHIKSDLETANARLEKLQCEREDLAERIVQAQAKAENAKVWRPTEGYEALVSLEVIQSGSVELEISYMVSGASWTPLYDVRLMDGDGEARLEVAYLAQVTQRSGEAWNNVDLTLSTAKPQSSGRLPELIPWLIRPATPIVYRSAGAGAAMPMMAAPAPQAETLGASPPPAPLETVVAEVSEEGPALTYHIPRRLSVSSDGSARKADIAHFTLTPELDYVTAPKLDAVVYRRAKVTNTSNYVLLPGQANVFWGDEFLGRAPLKNIAPGQQFELSLGADDRLTVERKPSMRSAEKALLRDVRRARYGYEIKVANLTAQTQHLIIQDQIPVSVHDRIVVRLDEATPQPSQVNEMGLLEWQLTLEPGQGQTVTFAFFVEHPRDMQVQGLAE